MSKFNIGDKVISNDFSYLNEEQQQSIIQNLTKQIKEGLEFGCRSFRDL